MEFLKNRKLLTGTILIIAGALFLVVNISSSTLFKSLRFDLTANKLYTLSPGSKEVLKEIDEPIILRLYYSKSLRNINPYLISFASRVEELLMQYQRASKGKVVVQVIDPEPFSPEEDAAVNMGLQGAPVDNTGTEFYLGLVGSNTLSARQVIPFLQPNREANLEYDISQLIFKLAHPQPRVVGLMSSLPLQGTPRSRPWAIWQQMAQLFDLQVVDYDTSEIPAHIGTLMLVEPSTFTKAALRAIDDFVMRGGHVLAFVDPISEVTDQETAALSKLRQKNAGDYLELMKSWGVSFDDSKAIADRNLAKTVKIQNNGREATIRYPLWMDFASNNFDKKDVLTTNLERLTFATPGALTKAEGATTNFSPLVTTSDDAMLVESGRVPEYQQNLNEFLNSYQATGAYTVAARISGPIKSPYTDATVNDSSILIFADTDMLFDHFWLNIQNVMGQEIGTPNSSNGNLILSALDNLSGSNALISIRNRGSFARPFDTVRELELRSQDKYRASEQALQQRLELTKQKLEALERQKKTGNTTLLSVQQKQEEEAFRRELVQTRQELRDVRRKLNHDLESVATHIKFYTIGLIPLLIVIGGLGLWTVQIQREQKNRKASCSILKH
jgi:ABC-type uncharacterized transport system involved in gliding motility auxiliary subunit